MCVSKKMFTFAPAFNKRTFLWFDFTGAKNADMAQLVEHWLPKPRVAGSSPVFRSQCQNSLFPVYRIKRLSRCCYFSRNLPSVVKVGFSLWKDDANYSIAWSLAMR